MIVRLKAMRATTLRDLSKVHPSMIVYWDTTNVFPDAKAIRSVIGTKPLDALGYLDLDLHLPRIYKLFIILRTELLPIEILSEVAVRICDPVLEDAACHELTEIQQTIVHKILEYLKNGQYGLACIGASKLSISLGFETYKDELTRQEAIVRNTIHKWKEEHGNCTDNRDGDV